MRNIRKMRELLTNDGNEIIKAVRENNPIKLQQLIDEGYKDKREDIDHKNEYCGELILSLAFRFRHLDCADILLNNGYNISEMKYDSNIPFISLFQYNDDKTVLHYLKKYGKDIEIEDNYEYEEWDNSALSYLIINKSVKSIKYIFDKNIYEKISSEYNDLSYAIAYRDEDTIFRLLREGQNINFQEDEQNHFADCCVWMSKEQINRLLDINRKKINVNIEDGMNDNALSYSYDRDPSFISYLLSIGVKFYSSSRYTILMYACENDDINLLNDFIQYIDDINETDNEDKNCLMYACENNSIEVIEFLLNNFDLDLNIQDESGYTAFNYACYNCNDSICKRLIDDFGEFELPATYNLYETFNEMINRGYLGNYDDEMMQELIEILCSEGNFDLIKLLIERDLFVFTDIDNLLIHCSDEDNDEIFRFLLENYGINDEEEVKDVCVQSYAIKCLNVLGYEYEEMIVSDNEDNEMIVVDDEDVNVGIFDLIHKACKQKNNDLFLYAVSLIENMTEFVDCFNFLKDYYTGLSEQHSMVEYFIYDEKLDYTRVDEHGNTCLMNLLKLYDRIDNRFIKHMIKRGVDINARNNEDKNALSYAIDNADNDNVRFLVENEAQIAVVKHNMRLDRDVKILISEIENYDDLIQLNKRD